MATVSNKFSRNLRKSISEKINKLPLKYFDNHSYGDILSRVTNDVDSIGMNLNQSIATLVSAVTLFLGCILMMFITNWVLALTAIFSTFVGFIFMSIVLPFIYMTIVIKWWILGAIALFIFALTTPDYLVAEMWEKTFLRDPFSRLWQYFKPRFSTKKK